MKDRRVVVGVIILASLFGFSLVFWLNSWESRFDLVEVPVAVTDLNGPKAIVKSDIKLREIPKFAIPKSAILNKQQLVGAVLTRSVGKDSWLTSFDLAFDEDPNSDAMLLPDGAKGLVIPASWFMSPFPKVKPHDFIDVYGVSGGSKYIPASSRVLLKGVAVLRVVTGKEDLTSSVLVALQNSDAQTLLLARAAQVPLLLVVNSRK